MRHQPVEKVLEVFDRADCHTDYVAVGARHPVGLQHLGHRFEPAAHVLAVVAGGDNADHRLHAKAKLGQVDACPVSGQNACQLQPPHPLGNRRRAQRDVPPQLGKS